MLTRSHSPIQQCYPIIQATSRDVVCNHDIQHDSMQASPAVSSWTRTSSPLMYSLIASSHSSYKMLCPWIIRISPLLISQSFSTLLSLLAPLLPHKHNHFYEAGLPCQAKGIETVEDFERRENRSGRNLVSLGGEDCNICRKVRGSR